MTHVLTQVPTPAAISVAGLGKRYRRGLSGEKWALRDCSFELPAGRVAALVGANGAGKTTLLTILAGLIPPTTGTARRARTAFVAQDKPLYRRFTAADMLRFGARLNQQWDQRRAEHWLDRFEVPTDQRCGTLSGGQQAQVAFALAIGSRPSVLLLDEPLSNVDPLGRVEVVRALLSEVEETGLTVLLSTHVVAELGGLADYLLLLDRAELRLSGDLDDVLDRHRSYVGPRADAPPGPGTVLRESHTDRQSTFLVELGQTDDRPVVTEPWVIRPVTLEELVLSHLDAGKSRPSLAVAA